MSPSNSITGNLYTGVQNLFTYNSALAMGKGFVIGSATSLLGGYAKTYKHAGQVGAIGVLATAIYIFISPLFKSLKGIQVQIRDKDGYDVTQKSIRNTLIDHATMSTALISSMFIAKKLGFPVNMQKTIAKYTVCSIVCSIIPGPQPLNPTYE